MQKTYVIMAPFWDYNDEYFINNEGSGLPVAVFNDKKNADTACTEMELKAWRENLCGEEVSSYMYDSYAAMVGFEAENVARAKLAKAFPDENIDIDFDLGDFIVPKEVTDEQIMVLREVYNFICFNRVDEVLLVND